MSVAMPRDWCCPLTCLSTHINDHSVAEVPTGPFGGEKNSGIGRFGGEWIIRELTRDHWITVRHQPTAYPLLVKSCSSFRGSTMTNPSKQTARQASLQTQYDFIVVGAGAAGSVLAAELSASGAHVLVVESGGPDDAPTIANPSIWFYNVGGRSTTTCPSTHRRD